MTATSRICGAALLAVGLLGSGCVHHLPVAPDVRANGATLPMRAAVVMDDAFSAQQDELGKFSNLGSSKYVVDTGRGVAPAIVETARRVFSSVAVVSSVAEAGNADIVLLPQNASLKHPAGRDDYTVRFELKAVAQKPNGRTVFEQSYAEEVAGSASVAQNQGAAAAHEVLGQPAERAIAMALTRLANDLRSRLGDGVDASSGFADFPGQLSAPPAVSARAEAPPPVPPPSRRDDAPRAAPTPAPVEPELSVRSAPSSSSKRLPLLIAGGTAFVAGYVAPIAISAGVPGGDMTMGFNFIPLAGPIIATASNPYFSSDAMAWTLAIGSAAVQAAGLALFIGGLLSGGDEPTSTVQLVPTLLPNGGVGVALAGSN